MADGPKKPRGVRIDLGSITDPVDPDAPLLSFADLADMVQERSATIEQSERSSEKVVVPEGTLPRTWQEAFPYVVWVVFVLGFGLEAVTAFVHGEWLHLIVSLVGLVCLMAAALHWDAIRSWARRTSPNWVWGSFALLLSALILAPFVEQHRWPFSKVFHDPSTAEDITKVTVPIQAKLNEAIKERDAARAELEKTQRELVAAQIGPAVPSASLPATGDEIANMGVIYSGSSIAVVSTSAHIKEALVLQTISSYSGSLSSGNSWSIPIRVKLDGEYGPFDVLSK